jgi:hypothetical protein
MREGCLQTLRALHGQRGPEGANYSIGIPATV